MNIHNELYMQYQRGEIGSYEILTAYDKGYIDEQSCNVILATTPHYTLDQAIAHKSKEFNYFCENNIANGISVELEDGTIEHFSLTTNDQIDINYKMNELLMGATSVEYHADNGPFRVYSAKDMTTICLMAKEQINTETIYRNNLREWIRQLKDVDEIRSITYGTPIPEEYWTEGWRSIQEKIKAAKSAVNEPQAEPVALSDEQPAEEAVAEEKPKENIVTKAVKAVTGKSRKKKNTEVVSDEQNN